nr:putative outer membrane porin HofQ [Candidatus Pantoea persica]
MVLAARGSQLMIGQPEAAPRLQQLNLLLAPGVEGQLSLRLDDVPWRKALRLVTRLAQLTVLEEENVWLVCPESWRQYQQQEQQAASVEQLPLALRTVTLR